MRDDEGESADVDAEAGMFCAVDEEPDALRTTPGVSMAASNALGDACGGGSSPVSAVVLRAFDGPCHGFRPDSADARRTLF